MLEWCRASQSQPLQSALLRRVVRNFWRCTINWPLGLGLGFCFSVWIFKSVARALQITCRFVDLLASMFLITWMQLLLLSIIQHTCGWLTPDYVAAFCQKLASVIGIRSVWGRVGVLLQCAAFKASSLIMYCSCDGHSWCSGFFPYKDMRIRWISITNLH